MTHDLLARPAVDRAQAHLREDGLDTGEQQSTVVPGGEVRGGEHQVAAGAQDSADLVQRVVRVHQVLHDLAEEHRVGRRGRERQPAVGEFTADRVRHVGVGASEGVLRPVDADQAVSGEEGRGGRGRGAVAAADVQHGLRARRGRSERGGQHAGLAQTARGAGGDGDGGVLVEVAKSPMDRSCCGCGSHTSSTSVACR